MNWVQEKILIKTLMATIRTTEKQKKIFSQVWCELGAKRTKVVKNSSETELGCPTK